MPSCCMKDKMSDIGMFKCERSHGEGSAGTAAVKELLKGRLRGERSASGTHPASQTHLVYAHTVNNSGLFQTQRTDAGLE